MNHTPEALEQLRRDLERRYVALHDDLDLSRTGQGDLSVETVRDLGRIACVIAQFAAEHDLTDTDTLVDLASLTTWCSRNLAQAVRSGPILAALLAVRDDGL